MESYFSAIQPHLQDRVDFALISNSQNSSSKALVSVGIDNLVYLRDYVSNQEERIQLNQNSNYQCIAKGTSPRKCILGSQNGNVDEFNLQTQQIKQIYRSQFKINSLTNSPNNRYLAVGSQESKCILVDMQTFKFSKCRPGHEQGVANTAFSFDQKYLASIGKDKSLLIYSIQNFDQPLQMYRYKVCKSDQVDAFTLNGCFHKHLAIFYSPGGASLQRIQLLNSKWQHHVSSFIKHQQGIINLVKVIKTHILITCTQSEFFIWNNKTQQKIIVIQGFSLYKVIEVNQKFCGCKNDGKIYFYQKQLNQSIFGALMSKQMGQTSNSYQQQMQIQPELHSLEPATIRQDVINFDDEEEQESEQMDKSNIEEQEYKFQQQKKSKADKIITEYPQQPVSNRTLESKTQNSRYIHTSHNGYLVQTKQNQFEIRVQFQSEDQSRNQLLFINKEILFADFNQQYLVYANQTSFGIKFLSRLSTFDSWQKNWWEICGIACTFNWAAVANQQQIKILDITGNQIKTICFDRQIVSMAAYQNLLAVVYHQSIPIEGAQCLKMQLYVVNNQKNEAVQCSSCHVPVKPKSKLNFFRFTNQGMLISSDTSGFIRVYNLQHNTWTCVFIQSIEDTRRLWLLGMQNYQIIYWKTSQINPNPEVFPRLPVKQSRLGINIAAQDSQDMKQYPFLMFQRFRLDHQKCRTRLWYHLKTTRKQKHSGFGDISTILSEKQLMKHHNQLDNKFFTIISYYIKSSMMPKAVMAVKSLIRTLDAVKQLIDIFDECKKRNQAIQIQIYYQEKLRQLEYESMQILQLQNLKQEAEKCIKPKGQNNPFNKKKNDMSSIPSLNNSQMSQGSNFDNLSQRSSFKDTKQNGIKIGNKNIALLTPQKQQFQNPFLKKKSTDQEMNLKKRQIEEQIQKFGVKKKAQPSRKPLKN